MGLFNSIFKKGKETTDREITKIPWHELTSETDLGELEKESEEKLVVIYKHSTRCGISRMVLKRFENDFDLNEGQSKLYFLDILNNRALSTEIACRFQVVHESPQLIAIKNGEVVHQASHQGISSEDLKQFI